MLLQKLQNGKDNIIDVAKPRGLTLLSMVQSTSPIDGNITSLVVQLNSSANRSTSISLAERVEPIKDGTILTNIEPLQLPVLILLCLRGYVPKEGNVIIRVESAQVPVPRREGLKHLHILEEPVVG